MPKPEKTIVNPFARKRPAFEDAAINPFASRRPIAKQGTINPFADPDKAHICPICGGHRTQKQEGNSFWWVCVACEQEKREAKEREQ